MENETKIFIAGSRRLSRLSQDVKHRIDNIINKGFTVIVGDANGMDKAVQQYLHSKNYGNVVVFCMEGICRNNVGIWPTRRIAAANPSRRDFAYFATKDRVMVEEANYGLMLWDGESRGTLTSIVDLVKRGKPVVVYVAPRKTFKTLSAPDQLSDFVSQFDPASLHRIEHELHAINAAPVHLSPAAVLF
jgi:hypothetical protein